MDLFLPGLNASTVQAPSLNKVIYGSLEALLLLYTYLYIFILSSPLIAIHELSKIDKTPSVRSVNSRIR
ncbi:hypothetical protein M501DRAFT_1000013 [Patellaria atrata CBS 101060]|uniref:Uncharacterized protein n=1 Tax=Patellaria atrata CBS 101060 TaxID=1346257 RepID=A0A9P4S317_9PEZI|nr:hypothetical protein M501DRAFT_1000013 [Patellaria atrata CBS 101060]